MKGERAISEGRALSRPRRHATGALGRCRQGLGLGQLHSAQVRQDGGQFNELSGGDAFAVVKIRLQFAGGVIEHGQGHEPGGDPAEDDPLALRRLGVAGEQIQGPV